MCIRDRSFPIAPASRRAAQLYHRHPPTGWSDWEGPLRPRAFDLNKLDGDTDSPWEAVMVLHNAHCQMRVTPANRAMDPSHNAI